MTVGSYCKSVSNERVVPALLQIMVRISEIKKKKKAIHSKKKNFSFFVLGPKLLILTFSRPTSPMPQLLLSQLQSLNPPL